MGYVQEDYVLHVAATISNHNSKNDKIDRELWLEIEQFINTKAAEIESFIQQPKYKRINPYFL